jgi:hypothetical protein
MTAFFYSLSLFMMGEGSERSELSLSSNVLIGDEGGLPFAHLSTTPSAFAATAAKEGN